MKFMYTLCKFRNFRVLLASSQRFSKLVILLTRQIQCKIKDLSVFRNINYDSLMCVCVCVCMYVCVYVCIGRPMYIHTYLYVYICIYVYILEGLFIYMYVDYVYICMYVCMYV